MAERIPPSVAQRNLEMGAVYIKLRTGKPPLWHGKETPRGTVHAATIEIGLGLGRSLRQRLYMDMKNDGRFENPYEGKVACYRLTASGDAWADRLLEEHAAGKKPWLLNWTRAEQVKQRFQRPVMLAAVAVIPVLIIEVTAHSEPWTTIGFLGDVAIWLTFTAELVSMLKVVPNRWEYLRTYPLDVVIVVLTPPLIPSVLQSLRLLRVLRVLRVYRLRVFSLGGVQYAAVLAFLTLIAGGQAYADAERTSFLQGCYWALTTMTTVGYGDEAPETFTGKAVATVVMIVGIGFIAVVTGAIANTFVKGAAGYEANTQKRLADMVERLDRLEAILREYPRRDDR